MLNSNISNSITHKKSLYIHHQCWGSEFILKLNWVWVVCRPLPVGNESKLPRAIMPAIIAPQAIITVGNLAIMVRKIWVISNFPSQVSRNSWNRSRDTESNKSFFPFHLPPGRPRTSSCAPRPRICPSRPSRRRRPVSVAERETCRLGSYELLICNRKSRPKHL